jgi:hypothetical protein
MLPHLDHPVMDWEGRRASADGPRPTGLSREGWARVAHRTRRLRGLAGAGAAVGVP